MHADSVDQKVQMVTLGEWHVVVDIAAGLSESEAAEISVAVTNALAEWASDCEQGPLGSRARVRVDV